MQLEVVLETERLRMTNWLPEHLGDLVHLHGNPEVTRYFSVSGEAETEERALQRLDEWADLFRRRRLGKLRVTDKETGTFLGRAGYGVYGAEEIPEIGYALLPENWGKGYATEAAAGLRDWFFEETGDDYFIGFADVRNEASIAVLRKIGMTPTGISDFSDGMPCAFHIFRREHWNG